MTLIIDEVEAPPKHLIRSAYLDRDSIDAETRDLVFVASTSGVKRDGIDLRIDGMETGNFESNPVFLWVHDYYGRTLPLGKVTKIRKLKNRVDVTVEFDQDDDFAVEVERKYRDGYLSAVSIGWDILEWHRVEDDEESDADFIVTRWDLLDVSAVPVPGDPSALIKTQRTFLRDLGLELIEAAEESVNGTTEVVVDADTFGERFAKVLETLEESVTRISEYVGALPPPEPVGEVIEFGPLELVAIRDALNKE